MKKNKLNSIIICGYLLLAAWIIVTQTENQDYYPVTQAFLALLMLPVPSIITRCFKISINPKVISTYYIFCIFSILCGSALRWYAKLPGWDKFLHFASGFLIAFVGIALFNQWKNINTLSDKVDYLFFAIYTIAFTLAGAVIWEFYEYVLYVFLGIDALNVASTGVHDTIQDMLVCGMGGICTSIWSITQIKKGKTLDFIVIHKCKK